MGGKNKISLAKRAAHKKGWQTISYTCRGVEVTRHIHRLGSFWARILFFL